MKKVVALTSCFIGSILTIIIIYLFSTSFNHRKNGFIRLFPPHIAVPLGSVDIKYNSYYIAGLTSNEIYLGNETSPTHLLVANQSLTDTHHFRISLPKNEKISEASLKVTVDPPNIYMVEGLTPTYLYGKTNELKLSSVKIDTMLHFGLSTPLTSTSIILRKYYREFQQNGLIKISLSNVNREAPKILKKQVDGIFCTDGMFNYSFHSSNFLYVYFYRNEFLCIDTNLNVIYKATTIDTNTRAKIKVASIRSEDKSVLAGPPQEVNRASCVSDKWLFINSALMANNEKLIFFKDHSVVDVYDIKNGRYRCSFYIPNPDGKKITSMAAHDNRLFTINDHFLQTFTLNL
jgi:hypothetical protein